MQEDGDQSKVRASNGSDAPLRQLHGDVGAAMDPNTYSGVEKYAFMGLYNGELYTQNITISRCASAFRHANC